MNVTEMCCHHLSNAKDTSVAGGHESELFGLILAFSYHVGLQKGK